MGSEGVSMEGVKTYDQLREEGYIQYIVMLSRGTYEGSSVPQIVFYVLLKEDKSPTEIADLFKAAFKDYVAEVNKNNNIRGIQVIAVKSPKDCFNDLFEMQWHETIEFEYLEVHGWQNRPHFYLPIKKIVTLEGMEDYLEDEPQDWLFNDGRHVGGSVTSEVFDSHSVESPYRNDK